MKQILSVLSIALALIAVIWFAGRFSGQKNELQLASPGFLESSEESFDFREISMTKGVVSHEFKIKNSAENPVEINSIYTSCMCTSAILEVDGRKFGPFGMPGHGFTPKIRRMLAVGEEVKLLVEFDPAAHGPAGVGPISRIVTVETSDGAQLNLGISALVKP